MKKERIHLYRLFCLRRLKTQIWALFFVVFLIFAAFLPKIANATTLIFDFDNYETGSICGQDEWFRLSDEIPCSRVVDDKGYENYKSLSGYSVWNYAYRQLPSNEEIKNISYYVYFTSDFTGSQTMGFDTTFYVGYGFGSAFYANHAYLYFERHGNIYIDYGEIPKNIWLKVIFEVNQTEHKVRGKIEGLGDWTNWYIYNEEDPSINYMGFGGYNPTGGNPYYLDHLVINEAPPLLPTIEFLLPENQQSLDDFMFWVFDCKNCPIGNYNYEIKYNLKNTNYYYYDIGTYHEPLGGDFPFYLAKKNPLRKGTWQATAKFWIGGELYEPEPIEFTILSIYEPIYPTPFPQFGTSTWGIDDDYIIQNYAENIPSIFSTTTPYSFYITITKGFNNFVKPFAEFILSIKSRLETIQSQGFGSSTAYIINLTSSINQIFDFPIIPIILIYILFLISFFIFKFIFKIIRG